MAQDSSHSHCHMASGGLVREMCVQLEGETEHVHERGDSREAGQLQAPGFTRDTATQKPHQGGSRRAPQRGHAKKSKFGLERDHRVT